MCGETFSYSIIPERFRTPALNAALGIEINNEAEEDNDIEEEETYALTLVCGSPGESAKNPTLGRGSQYQGAFNLYTRKGGAINKARYAEQKQSV